jgi:hypothetical protein
MRHFAQPRKTVMLAVVVLAVLALLMATVALAAAPKAARTATGEPLKVGKQATGTITQFTPASVVAGSSGFSLTMELSSVHAAVPAWTVTWSGDVSGPLSVEASGTASVTAFVPAANVAAVGHADITVSDGMDSWLGTFQITPAAPHIDSLSPNSAVAGGPAFTLRVNGSNFQTGVLPAVVRFNGTILADALPTGPVNPTAILYVTVPANLILTPGPATVTVTNPLLGGGVVSNTVPFAISGPTVTAIEPSTGANSNAALSFVLRGTDLNLAATGTAVALKGTTGATAGITVNATGVAYVAPLLPGGEGTIIGTLNLASGASSATSTSTAAPSGTYDVVLTYASSGTRTFTLAGAFTVTGPTLTDISPATATNGNSAVAFTLTGTGLNGLIAPVVTLKGPGTAGTTVITATGVASVAPGTTMTGTFNLTSPTVPPSGLYDVILTYAGTKTLTLAQKFAVTNAVPVVTSVSPNTTWAGSVKPQTLTITGSGFVPAPPLLGAVGSQVKIGTRLTTNTTFVSATQLTVPLTAADIAAAGTVPISVVNPTPGGGTSAAVNLTVTADTTAPVTAISGADTAWHNTPVTLTVTSTDSQSGVQSITWAIDGSTPTTVPGVTTTTVVVPAPAGGSGDGAKTVTASATDWCNNAENPPVSVTVNIDTVGPKTTASAPSSVKKGTKVTFKYKANDVSPKCTITLKIKKSNGSVTRTYSLGKKTSNKSYTYKVNPKLGTGTYTLCTYAKDLAGNAQSKLGTDKFKVK